jgi:peptidoglycan LD-endopeptidase LytH
MKYNNIIPLLNKYASTFYPIVPFDIEMDKLLAMDFTAANHELTDNVVKDIDRFCSYVHNKITNSGCKYGIGGYNELRTVYAASEHFNTKGEPRRLHLGIDIWGAAGTAVSAFMGGMIHSFAFNDNYGDYGATLILSHQLESKPFYTLYGHLSLNDIGTFTTGGYVVRGQTIAHFGEPAENGHWPPHLHFQIITDIGIYEGDYPGVCRNSEKEKYLYNCPDPDLILQMNQYLKKQIQ